MGGSDRAVPVRWRATRREGSGWRAGAGTPHPGSRCPGSFATTSALRRESRALFTCQKILQNFSHSLSHRIFRRMHEVLNIDENKN